MKGYHCNCDYGKNSKGTSKLKPVEVTSEGICVHCGYYAAFLADEVPKSLKPKEFFNNYELHVEFFKPKRSLHD